MTLNGKPVHINWGLITGIGLPLLLNIIVLTVYITRLSEQVRFLREDFDKLEGSVSSFMEVSRDELELIKDTAAEAEANARVTRAEVASRLSRIEHILSVYGFEDGFYEVPPRR